MRPWPGENDRVTKGLGLRLHLPDNGSYHSYAQLDRLSERALRQ